LVAEVVEDGQAPPQAVDRLLVTAQALRGDAQVAEINGLAVAVVHLRVDRQALLMAGQGPLVATLTFVDEAEVGEAVGLAVAVAQLLENGQAPLVAIQGLLVASHQLVGDAEVVVGLGLGFPVAGPSRHLQRDLVGLDAVVPGAADVEEREQGVGELGRELARDAGGGGGLPHRGEQIAALRLEPAERAGGVGEARPTPGPARIGPLQAPITRAQQLVAAPDGTHIEPERAAQHGGSGRVGMLSRGKLPRVQAQQVVQPVTAGARGFQ
jgi:hypothetical protein